MGLFYLQAIISVMVMGATIAMIMTGVAVPEWWPPLAVAIVGFLFGRRNGVSGGLGGS